MRGTPKNKQKKSIRLISNLSSLVDFRQQQAFCFLNVCVSKKINDGNKHTIQQPDQRFLCFANEGKTQRTRKYSRNLEGNTDYEYSVGSINWCSYIHRMWSLDSNTFSLLNPPSHIRNGVLLDVMLRTLSYGIVLLWPTCSQYYDVLSNNFFDVIRAVIIWLWSKIVIYLGPRTLLTVALPFILPQNYGSSYTTWMSICGSFFHSIFIIGRLLGRCIVHVEFASPMIHKKNVIAKFYLHFQCHIFILGKNRFHLMVKVEMLTYQMIIINGPLRTKWW